MADTKDYYLQNCQTLIPQSVVSGGVSTGATIILLSNASMDSTAMVGALQQIITDYYSYNATGGSVGDMTHWATGVAATGCINLGTASAFQPLATAGALYTWITNLNSGYSKLNFMFGSTSTPSLPGTGGIAATAMTQQVAVTQVLNSSGNIDATQLAVVIATPSYKSGATSYYRGATKVAIRVDAASCPSTVSVSAWPAILKANCVTSTDELILPSGVTPVSSC